MIYRWQDWGLVERDAGVLVSCDDICSIDGRLILALKEYARSLPELRACALFQSDERFPLHNALIAAERFTISPPHTYEHGPLSWTAMDGDLAFVRYQPSGDIAELQLMSSQKNERAARIVRLASAEWHTIVPLTDMPVYLETKLGLANPDYYASWGPQSIDDPRAGELIEMLGNCGYSK